MEGANKKFIFIGILAVLVIVALSMMNRKSKDTQDYSTITNFIQCQDAGFPVNESFPAQCQTPDGRTFVDDIAEHAEVVIDSPTYGGMVTSPLQISGKAKGFWFFEAQLPVTLKDQNGKVLAHMPATAQGDWMTEEFVNFTVTLEFEKPETQFGVLIVEKDNPSGLPENDAAYAIPVTFK